MDNEKLKQFLLPILILVVALAASVMLVTKVVDNQGTISGIQAEIEQKNGTIQDLQNQVEAHNKQIAEQKRKEEESEKGEKPFYKPVMSGMDTEAIIAGEFAEILQLIRANKIKVRTIKYDYEPKDDSFVQNAGEKYNVARLNMEMIGNYTDYNNFLKEMYKHEHFLDMQSVEIVPYKKNKKILLINFKVKLYAKK